MGRVFDDPSHRAAARVVVGLVTAQPADARTRELLAHDLGAGEFSPHVVAAGASVLLDRIIVDVGRLLRMSRADTLEALGGWVAADEFTAGG